MTAVAAAALLIATKANSEEVKPSGMISSTGATVVLSTKEMMPGIEMWALLLSLNPGGKVVSPGTNKGKWTSLELVVNGTSTSQMAYPKGVCSFFGPGFQREPSGETIVARIGEASACNYSSEFPWSEENRGKEIFTKAGLYVGGPGEPEDTHIGPEYEKTGTVTSAMGYDSSEFAAMDPELRAAGAMTVAIRQVTMPPGTRMATTDRYPTLRMVTSGTLKYGTLPADAPQSAAPKGLVSLVLHEWIHWTRKGQVVVANESGKPAQFIEFSVAPAPGGTP